MDFVETEPVQKGHAQELLNLVVFDELQWFVAPVGDLLSVTNNDRFIVDICIVG
jgi:hypothetical protein